MLIWATVAKLGRNSREKRAPRHHGPRLPSAAGRARPAGPRENTEPRLLPTPAIRADGLLRLCIAASARGTGFYEIYDELLRPSALVGNGVFTVAAAADALRKVPVRTGGAFIFDESTRQWRFDRRSSLLG